MKLSTFTKLFVSGILALGLTTTSLSAETKKDFKVAWSIYVGWMPWDVIESQKIMDKWAKKYGINIEIVQINDYIESINLPQSIYSDTPPEVFGQFESRNFLSMKL
jgi:NitT/TauT family transport system substrate-binding protein